MIGISVSKEQIFPIVVKDFTGGDRNCDEYKTYFSNLPSTEYQLNKKITRKKTKSYSAKSPEIELMPQILKLFDRLTKIHKQFENKAMEIDSMGKDRYKIGSAILSMDRNIC